MSAPSGKRLLQVGPLALLLGVGCATPRLAVPNLMDARAPTRTSTFALSLERVTITNLDADDDRRKLVPLRATLEAHLSASGAELIPEVQSSTAWPSLSVHLRPEVENHRTYVLDVLSVVPGLGLFPLTPEWGTASVEAVLRLRFESGHVEERTVRGAADYSHVFYAWHRDDARLEALARAYNLAFSRVTELVRAALERPDTSQRPAMAQAPPEWLGTESEAGFRVIARPVDAAPEPGLLRRYLGSLGGLEGAITGGAARVTSSARTEAGEERVGEGNAVTSGFRLAFFRPPSRTGFFFPPLLGFFSQDIDISGFVDAVPVHQVPGAVTVGARVTDPETFTSVDLSQPLSYALRLRSGYLGQGIGLNLVLGTDDVQLFGTLRFGLNLLEVRHTDVSLETKRELGWSAAFVSSGQLGAQAGLTFPDLHLSLRVAAELEYFRSFSYPDPLEFQAATVFNPVKEVYERERVFVDGAEVSTINWQVSATYVF